MSQPLEIKATLRLPRAVLIEVIHEALRTPPQSELSDRPGPVHRDPPPLRLCRKAEVVERTGLSASSVYALASKGRFPRPVKLGERSAAWVESEVTAWIEARIAERDEQQTKS